MTTTTTLKEMRYYNGVIPGLDLGVIYRCLFIMRDDVGHVEISGGLRADGKQNFWCESNAAWLQQWFPQIVADVAVDPVEGWSLGASEGV